MTSRSALSALAATDPYSSFVQAFCPKFFPFFGQLEIIKMQEIPLHQSFQKDVVQFTETTFVA